MISFFKTIIYEPLYNIFIFINSISPVIDVGIAIILLTLLVRLFLFPLSKKATLTQQKLQIHQDELKEIKEKYKDDKQKQADKMMKFYKEKEINPFSSLIPFLIQMPIIISLYMIFVHTNLPDIQMDLLYSFVPTPDEVNMNFLGIMDISGKSVLLAILAGATGFLQLRLSMPAVKERKENPSFKDELSRNMNLQMRYVFPVFIGLIAYFLSAVVALYLLTSNIFSVIQELYLRKDKLKFKEELDKKNQEKEKKQEEEKEEKEKGEKTESVTDPVSNKGKKKKKNGRKKRK